MPNSFAISQVDNFLCDIGGVIGDPLDMTRNQEHIVNAPFSCPNNSDSTSASGIAPQFIATKGLFFRRLESWIARASNSFPVPDSPSIKISCKEASYIVKQQQFSL